MPATPEPPHTDDDTLEVAGEPAAETAEHTGDGTQPEAGLNREQRRLARKKGKPMPPGGRSEGKITSRGQYGKVPKQRQFSHRRRG